MKSGFLASRPMYICDVFFFQEALIHAADTGKDYEHCIELQKKANDHESAVSISIQLNLCKKATLKKPENWFSRPIIA